jgi:predicted outer membrane repeat protein
VTTADANRVAAPISAASTVSVSWLALAGVVFEVTGPATLSLDNVRMSGANKPGPWAVKMVGVGAAGQLIATQSEFSDFAWASPSGGAIFTDAATKLDRCTLARNSADFGGALYVGSGGSLAVDSCTFSSNTASGSSAMGGAIYTEATSVAISRSTFASNLASFGGAVYCKFATLR